MFFLFAAALPAAAQTNAEVNAGIQFNFSTPGARSLGLGGAFLALADDATAAYSNPAGLTALSRPEVSGETRRWGFTNTYTDRGRAAGAPIGNGVDTVAGLRKGEDEESAIGLSFLSAVYPKGRWAVAIYRHELADFDGSFEAQGAFLNGLQRLRPTRNSMSLDIENLGLATACHLNDLSLGIGISLYDFRLKSRTQRYYLAFPPDDPARGGNSGLPLYADTNLEDTQTQSGDDRAVGVNAGVLWQLNDDWRFGAVYRQGPKFKVDAEYSPGPRATGSKTSVRRAAHFDTPDVFGIGAAYLPTEMTTITLDLVRVRYADLTRTFTNIYPTLEEEPGHYRVDDADEVHLGVEHFFLSIRGMPFAARIGAWRDPDHKIRYTGDRGDFRALFRAGNGHFHSSAGIGLSGTRFQVDAAFDYSEQVRTASLSTVVRF